MGQSRTDIGVLSVPDRRSGCGVGTILDGRAGASHADAQGLQITRMSKVWALSRTFFRSFFLQTLWNFERMQNVGFAFSIVPLLQQLDLSKAAFRKVLRRQLAFFNTHPYSGPIIMGVVYAKEKTRDSHDDEDP